MSSLNSRLFLFKGMCMKIETERLIIRKFEMNDYFDLFEMCSDPNTAYLAGWRPHKDLNTSKNVVLNYMYSGETYAIILKEEDKLIGTVSLYKEVFRKDVGARELGFCLNKDYREKGYMTEAVGKILEYGFKHLDISYIFAYTMPNNLHSQAILEHYHFLYEGCLRKFRRLFNKEIIDVKMYSLLKEEFI